MRWLTVWAILRNKRARDNSCLLKNARSNQSGKRHSLNSRSPTGRVYDGLDEEIHFDLGHLALVEFARLRLSRLSTEINRRFYQGLFSALSGAAKAAHTELESELAFCSISRTCCVMFMEQNFGPHIEQK